MVNVLYVKLILITILEQDNGTSRYVKNIEQNIWIKMNTEIMNLFFPEELERIKKGKCPLCDKNIDPTEFKDKLSVKEFRISGMCQSCQIKMFG